MKQIFTSLKKKFQEFSKTKKRILLGLVSTLILFLIFALGSFVILNTSKCIEGDCKNGFGTLRFRNGAVYKGQFAQSKFHGFGIFTHPKGDSYEGDWIFGKKHGKGIYKYADRSRYEGDFFENEKHGVGTFFWPGKTSILKANFFQGEPEGVGELTIAGGIKLLGMYRKGVIYEGGGIYIYEDGSKYIGEWKSGKRNGTGILMDLRGTTLKNGTWKDDQNVADIKRTK
ncbi:MORN repeat-containing protein [Leptospira weilii]|uniref:MORN repeat protein n=1 Tax=Leptospira weilii str. UI 13098 TaxID=1088542 RepID=M6Q2K1_9LEPT|nr:MORN repeat protein [Leptospira weilii]EMN89504.1 MORN repeat protein [Leptospira weilii str. UI 13098]